MHLLWLCHAGCSADGKESSHSTSVSFRKSSFLIWGEGSSRGWPERWLRWFAHTFGGVLCRGYVQCPDFLLAPQKWLFDFWPFCILLPIIFPNCPCTQLFIYFCLFFLLRAALLAYGRSQARGQIGASASGLHYSHSKARSLTHWVKPGIKPASSWILVGFVTTEPQQGLQHRFFAFCCSRRHLSRCKLWSKGSQVPGPSLSQCLLMSRSS